jgi:uncharacterized protein (TIGR03435 family)
MLPSVVYRTRFVQRFLLLGVCTVMLSASRVQAQTPAVTASLADTSTETPAAATPEFEAATIKPVKEPAPYRLHDSEEGRRFQTRYTSLNDLIVLAYGVDRRQVVGAPAWVTHDEYDVDAVADDGVKLDGNNKLFEAMLQKLLADRFQLTVHREQREMPVYALVVAKGGAKLKVADPTSEQNNGCRSLGVCFFTKETLSGFARFMGFVVMDKPVVDKTGLTGEYDFELKWTPDDSQFASMGVRPPTPNDNANAPPGLFTAIQEQLGLKLEPQKTSAEVLVIDHVERPSEN